MRDLQPLSGTIATTDSNVPPGRRKGRLLFLTSIPFFQWRGSSIRIGFNVQALAELGYEVHLLTIPVGETKETPGVTVHRVANPLRVKNIPIGPSAHKLLFDVLILFKALALITRHRYQVVHAVEEVGIIGLLIGRLAGARVIFEKHSDPASHKKNTLVNMVLSLYRWVESLTIRYADVVIGTGEGLVEQAMAVAPRQRVHHIFDIPSSLTEANEGRREKIATSMRRCPKEVVALYVGSFAVYQGIDLMFTSLPLALQSQPHLRLVVIGGSEAQIAERKEWLEQRGIGESVHFLGLVPPDHLPDYLCAADFLLSPRISGINTPLKLLDYLKAGKAILATDNVANRRIVDEEVALLTEARPPAFAAGMIELARCRNLREKLGMRGRRLVDEKYNFNCFKRLLKNCYEKLLVSLACCQESLLGCFFV